MAGVQHAAELLAQVGDGRLLRVRRLHTLVVHHKLRPDKVRLDLAVVVAGVLGEVLLVEGDEVVGLLLLLALARRQQERVVLNPNGLKPSAPVSQKRRILR